MKLRGLAAGLALGALVCAVQPALAAAPAIYSDAARDATRRAPEVTTVAVSNDDAGVMRFRINVGNQPQLARDASLELFVDTDQNPATGDPASLGADYRFVVDGASQTFEFGRWDGTRFDDSTPSTTVEVWYWSGVSISVNRSELGGASAVGFWVRASSSAQTGDVAPDQGTWSYSFQVGSTNPPDVDSFFYRMRPAVPRAGAKWELQVDTLRLVGTAGSVRPDRWSCAATLAGKPFRGSGPGSCTFRLPRSARGRKLVVGITVAYMGEVVTGNVSFRVR